MKKMLLLIAFLAAVPFVGHAQYAGANEEYQTNMRRGAADEEARRNREANENAPTRTYGRYNQYGDYIYGSHPGDTPYNTYPGPLAGKRKLTAWRAFRDDYKARKEAQKDARREYRRTH